MITGLSFQKPQPNPVPFKSPHQLFILFVYCQSNHIIEMKETFTLSFRFLCLLILGSINSTAQITINNNGCLLKGYGINANVLTNTTFTTGTILPPAGSVDWFVPVGGTGRSVVDQSNPTQIYNLLTGPIYNPSYSRGQNGGIYSVADVAIPNVEFNYLIDAVWVRDWFGGTGGTDTTAYAVSSKNGQDPAIWGPGATNVLGKNDLIDIGGHMFRYINRNTGKKDLHFFGLINRAEPGGDAYMDFEFFIQKVGYNRTINLFNTGGPDMGHTSFLFDPTGRITRLGDILFNVSLTNGGTRVGLELRVWCKYTDYVAFKASPPANLPWVFGPFFDGAGTNAAYGYASLLPKGAASACGFVNAAGQLPAAPIWGTKNTKANIFTNSYLEYSVSEIGFNMTDYGLDNYLVSGSAADTCTFPWGTFMVKTRSSASFTAALKDFAGPFAWGQPNASITADYDTLGCLHPVATLSASSVRADATYRWFTNNGNIIGSTTATSIQADKAGTYYLELTLSNGCKFLSPPMVIIQDPTQPLITGLTNVSTISCEGSNGSINLTVAGGTAPFTYSWTGRNGFTASTEDLTAIPSGKYVVSVTDSKGCQKTSDSITVLQGTPVSAPAVLTNVACFGQCTGAINITPSGRSPFTYKWSNGRTTEDIQNACAGNYNVIITDADGCRDTFYFTITQPTLLTSSVTKTDDTDPDPLVGNGTADLTPAGGTPGYTYSWTGPGGYTASTQDLSGLKYGSYTVLVTDANGCTTTKSIFIYEPEICNDAVDNDGDGLTNCEDPECTPAAPVISGNNVPCININTVYSVPPDPLHPGLTYTWTVPANATLVSGQGTSSVTVSFQTTVPGVICVTANNVGCLSQQVCYLVSPVTVPGTPTFINQN